MLTRRGLATSLVAWVFILLAPIGSWGAPPAEYYNGIDELSGGELKEELRKIISRDHRSGAAQHTIVPYELLHQPMREIWRNPENPDNILLVYSSPSVPATSTTWNREHLWASSRGVEKAGADYSDLFHVVPANSAVNSTRRDRYFDMSDVTDSKYKRIGEIPNAPLVSYDSDSWQPAVEERGDIARALFYMDVRYNGTQPDTRDLELVTYIPNGEQIGNLKTLLFWHEIDPPDEAELARNDLIYSNYQGNRNPFIDRPEFVNRIWGSVDAEDPSYLPFAKVETVAETASEQPASPAQIVVSLDRPAGPNGVTVVFSMLGEADFSEYTVTGDGVSFDPTGGSGQILIQEGQVEGLILITPLPDDLVESKETVQLILFFGNGYDFTPDTSISAEVKLNDGPAFPIYWDFDTLPIPPTTIPANTGVGSISTVNWTGTVENYAGETGQGKTLSLRGSAGNNSSIDIELSMRGYHKLVLTFDTAGTSSGFTSGVWSYSVDGGLFTQISNINTATNASTWVSRKLEFTDSSINDAERVVLRYTLSGATGGTGNNKIDNLKIAAQTIGINDNFSDAIELIGFPLFVTGNNTGATSEPFEPLHAGFAASSSVWWRWTAPLDANVVISTAGSVLDTILAVYTGQTVDTLTEVASNDQANGDSTSRVVFKAIAGQTYMIAVDGFFGASGPISLALEQSTDPAIEFLSRNSGMPGSTVMINGYNLSGVESVKFLGTSAEFSILSDNQILATVPSGAFSGYISVTSQQGEFEGSSWFSITQAPSSTLVTTDQQSLEIPAKSESFFEVSAQSIPGPLHIQAPEGFEVSLDGQNYVPALELSAPARFDQASNYASGWTDGSNEGNGFWSWYHWQSSGTGASEILLENPEDSGITGFGNQAFSVNASPGNSGAWAMVGRHFKNSLATGERFSFQWGRNWDPSASYGSNYFYIYSGDAWLLSVWQGNFPGNIYLSSESTGVVDTGIAYGTSPMTWGFELVDANTLRVTATGRNGDGLVIFSRDLQVSGSPSAFYFTAYEIDSDIRRRGYFNHLRIDSLVEGGGHLPSTYVFVRPTSNDQNLSGNISISSQGQSLAVVELTIANHDSYDSWLQTHDLDPLGNGDRSADPDGDGHSNLREFLFGTDPKSGQGTLFSHAMHNGNFVLTFLGRETGGNYSVQSTGNLVSGPWALELIDAIEAADQSSIPSGYKRLQFVIPVQPGNRFYRLKGDLPE